MGTRSNRDWPNGIRACSKCGRTFKQLQSLANHVMICTGPKNKRPRYRYPKHYREYLLKNGTPPEEANAKV